MKEFLVWDIDQYHQVTILNPVRLPNIKRFNLFNNVLIIVHTPQSVSSGQPWPANAEGYQDFSQMTPTNQRPISQNPNRPISLDDRVKEEETTTRRPSVSFIPSNPYEETIPAKPAVAPPSFYPVPIYMPQLVPSGDPWPGNAEGYQNFSQIGMRPSTEIQRPFVSLEDRVNEEANNNQGNNFKPMQEYEETIPAKPAGPVSSFHPSPGK